MITNLNQLADQYAEWMETQGHGLIGDDIVRTHEKLDDFRAQWGEPAVKSYSGRPVYVFDAMRPKGQPDRARKLFILDSGINETLLIADVDA